MTHMWCSGESDAPAVINMESMPFSTFRTNVRALSTTADYAARDALYSSVLTALHDEAIFLPITAKRQTAVTNKRVAGFQFGYMEFDLPLANLHPNVASNKIDQFTIAFIAAAVVALLLLLCVLLLICQEKSGKPVFTSTSAPKPPSGASVSSAGAAA